MSATATTGNERAPAGTRPPRGRQVLVLLLFLVLCLGVEAAITQVTRPALEPWYRELAKPAWTPPDLAFPIVWTALYLAMAAAAWLAWRAAPPGRFGWPLACFLLQLALNAGWSFAFFGARDVGLALIDLSALLLAVLATLFAFWPLSRWAGALLLPYLAWCGYAFALNAAIVRLNLL